VALRKIADDEREMTWHPDSRWARADELNMPDPHHVTVAVCT
jgi:hypothetical protein